MSLKIYEANTAEGQELMLKGYRPKVNSRGLVTNSTLDSREWKTLDDRIERMARAQLNIVADLRAADLTDTTTLATFVSQWRVASEKKKATLSMDGRTQRENDRADRKLYGVPLPIISQEYEIGIRELEASRRLGETIDTLEAEESAQAVGEAVEDLALNGSTTVVVGGSSIPGIRTITGRSTDTASNYGGGDFATEGNGRKTILGMISALSANRFHGPFNVYIASAQYHELMDRYTDGSGEMELDTILRIPQISEVKLNDDMPAGELAMIQMTPDVIDLLIAQEVDNREWTSPDGMAFHAAVVAAMTPRIKTNYAGNVGIAHATGA